MLVSLFSGYEDWSICAQGTQVKEGFAMKVILPDLSEQKAKLHEIIPRRDARKTVGLRVIISDKLGLASGEVTDISPGGCGLRLTKRLRLGQYLSLMDCGGSN